MNCFRILELLITALQPPYTPLKGEMRGSFTTMQGGFQGQEDVPTPNSSSNHAVFWGGDMG